jgi:hypothetical protein
MHEDKSRTGGVTPTKEDAESDATSKETVSDLGPATTSANPGSGKTGGSSTPSPDGQFDGPRDGAGPGEESGPM